MTRIDQFESVFKAAARTVYAYQRVGISKVLLVTDLNKDEAGRWSERVRTYLGALEGDGAAVDWKVTDDERSATIARLLEMVEEEAANLIVTYRNLHTYAWRWPYSLGAHLDVLTQATATPVLVLPRPEREEWKGESPDFVLALTDHLTGDARLVSWAVRFTPPDGELCLVHLEDEGAFERYMEVISKIPDIDTDTARQRIREQLLKEPTDYIVSAKEVLRAAGLPIRLSKVVTMGNHLADLELLIEERGADLLVLNTKDEDQMAMHGLAYPLAVELRSTPILML